MAENKEEKKEETEKKITISDLEYDKKGNLLFEEKILNNDKLEEIFKIEGTKQEESAVVSNADSTVPTTTSTVVTSSTTTTNATPVVNTSEPGEVVGTYTIEVTEEKLPSTPSTSTDASTETKTETTTEKKESTTEEKTTTTSDDKTDEKIKDILTNEEIEIDKKKYKTTLEKDGSLKSADGESKLTQDELLKELGKDAYMALLLKTKKNVTVTNGHIEIEDPKEEVTMEIKPSVKETGSAPKDEIKEEVKKEETKKETKEEEKQSNKSDISEKADTTPESTEKEVADKAVESDVDEDVVPVPAYDTKEEDTEKERLNNDQQTEKAEDVQATSRPDYVRVDFDQLKQKAELLRAGYDLLVQLQEEYERDVKGTATTWGGADGSYFREQKGKYAEEFAKLNETYLQFVDFIENTIEVYQEAENSSVSQKA